MKPKHRGSALVRFVGIFLTKQSPKEMRRFMRLSQCGYGTNQLAYDMGDCGGMEAVWLRGRVAVSYCRMEARMIGRSGLAKAPSEPEANDVGFRGPKSLKYNPREELDE
jgi:hypothetical protein